jgi:hypothetical protein
MYIAYTLLINVHTCMYQVLLINKAIDSAKPGSRLYKLPHVADPSKEIVEVLIQCMEWNIASRQSGIPESELPELQQKTIDLLDLLKKNLPDKTGEKAKWNFEKAHTTPIACTGPRPGPPRPGLGLSSSTHRGTVTAATPASRRRSAAGSHWQTGL